MDSTFEYVKVAKSFFDNLRFCFRFSCQHLLHSARMWLIRILAECSRDVIV